jgi:hypothetical protein
VLNLKATYNDKKRDVTNYLYWHKCWMPHLILVVNSYVNPRWVYEAWICEKGDGSFWYSRKERALGGPCGDRGMCIVVLGVNVCTMKVDVEMASFYWFPPVLNLISWGT